MPYFGARTVKIGDFLWVDITNTTPKPRLAPLIMPKIHILITRTNTCTSNCFVVKTTSGFVHLVEKGQTP
jgi:hypothetical protein